jgi:hypothetical protein
MCHYDTLSDDYYVNMNLNTEMDLPQTRESVLHFFEQIQKTYPKMRNFYSRERGEFVLEEEKDRGSYRWATVELRRVCSGHVNPLSIDDALQQHERVLDIVPYALTVTPLDCESLNVMFGFDFTYRGNHNQLLADALGVVPAFERLAATPGDDDCRVQCRLSFETRTSAYHVRMGEYPEEQLSVYLTARRYGGLDPGETYIEVMQRLAAVCRRLVDDCIAEQILRPLQEAIAIK